MTARGSVHGDLVRRVIAQLMLSVGGSDASSERAAEELFAAALQVTADQFRTWREDPSSTPLDCRLALSIWIESAGRSGNVASLRELGRRLREATQLERAAHMVAGSVRYGDWPRANRADLALAYAEVQCRRSPPPPVPVVDDYPLRVMFEELIVRDEGHFPGPERPVDSSHGGARKPC
jgi:hypothetical protein